MEETGLTASLGVHRVDRLTVDRPSVDLNLQSTPKGGNCLTYAVDLHQADILIRGSPNAGGFVTERFVAGD